ncbi:MAG: hypothetical protein DSZ10_01660 [Sulfurovum sp.]|nr:MAG: hypothetical protein DSZ10_01660 [Sulfurovum sp.]
MKKVLFWVTLSIGIAYAEKNPFDLQDNIQKIDHDQNQLLLELKKISQEQEQIEDIAPPSEEKNPMEDTPPNDKEAMDQSETEVSEQTKPQSNTSQKVDSENGTDKVKSAGKAEQEAPVQAEKNPQDAQNTHPVAKKEKADRPSENMEEAKSIPGSLREDPSSNPEQEDTQIQATQVVPNKENPANTETRKEEVATSLQEEEVQTPDLQEKLEAAKRAVELGRLPKMIQKEKRKKERESQTNVLTEEEKEALQKAIMKVQ